MRGNVSIRMTNDMRIFVVFACRRDSTGKLTYELSELAVTMSATCQQECHERPHAATESTNESFHMIPSASDIATANRYLFIRLHEDGFAKIRLDTDWSDYAIQLCIIA